MINREDLGKRVTGYMFYDADSKGFTGLTEKQIKDTLNKGERLYGLALDNEGNIIMDTEGFKTKNYMVRSGINSLAPIAWYKAVLEIERQHGIILSCETVNRHLAGSERGRLSLCLKTAGLLTAVQPSVFEEVNLCADG